MAKNIATRIDFLWVVSLRFENTVKLWARAGKSGVQRCTIGEMAKWTRQDEEGCCWQVYCIDQGREHTHQVGQQAAMRTCHT